MGAFAVPISPVSHGLTHTPGSQCLPLSLHLQFILSTYYSPVELESSYFSVFLLRLSDLLIASNLGKMTDGTKCRF